MCLDDGMIFGFLIFLAVASVAPFVIVAAIVHAVRSYRTDKVVRLLD